MKFLKYLLYFFILIILVFTILGHTEIGNLNANSNDFQYLKIDNNQIRYSQIGNGKDILLIHGTPGSIEDWTSISEPLSRNYRVTAFDRMGHGYSSNEDYNYNLKDNAAVVQKVIEKLDLKSPIIIGHSYGGSTVAHLLVNHYNDDLDYMIIDSPLFSYEPSFTYTLLSLPMIGKGIAFFANFTIAESQIENGIRASIVNQEEADLGKIIDIRKNIWLQPKVLVSKAKESINYNENLENISSDYRQISANVIIVTGEDDDITFRSQAEKFSQDVHTDSLVILPNTGHYIQLDQSEKIVALIEEKMK